MTLIVALALVAYIAFGADQFIKLPSVTFVDHNGPAVGDTGSGSGSNSGTEVTRNLSIESLPIVALPSIADLVEQVKPSVVSIDVESRVMTFFGTRISTGSGSGVIFREDGYILTNNHVIEDAYRVAVTLSDGRTLGARLIGTDPSNDLAVIKVDAEDLMAAPLADNSGLRVGDWVVAIGNALDLSGEHSVTLGVVSALGRSLSGQGGGLADLIQTDAVINPGNSGGPLIDLKGEVVGINTAVLRGSSVDGIGFAVSTDTVIPVINRLLHDNGVSTS